REDAMKTEATRALVQEMYKAYCSGDVPRLTGLLDPDFTFTIVGPSEHLPFYGTSHGRDAALRTLATMGSIYEVISYRVIDLLAGGGGGGGRNVGVLKHRQSGRMLELEIGAFIKVANGRITEIRELNDTLTAHADTFGFDVAALVPMRSV